MKKRMLSLLLALVMLLGMFPVQAFATEEVTEEPKVTISLSGYEVGKNIMEARYVVTPWSSGNSYNAYNSGICSEQNTNTAYTSGTFEAGKDYWLWLIKSEVTGDYTAEDIVVEGMEDAVVSIGKMRGDKGSACIWVKLPQLEAAAPATYGITVSGSENGTVTADKETAAEGETVTLTVTPAEGYELETLTVNGEAIEGTTFTMPAEAVTVAATFKATVVAPKVTIELTGYEVGKNIMDAKYVVTPWSSGNSYNAYNSGICSEQNTNTAYTSGTFEAGKDYWLWLIKSEVTGDYTAEDIVVEGMEDAVVSIGKMRGDKGSACIWVKLPQLEAAAPATYPITVSNAVNGTVTADKAEAAEGDTVKLTVTPAQYYALDTLTVTDAEVTKVNDTTYTFVMPAKAVEVSATFKQTSGMQQYFTVTVNGVEYPAQYIGVQYYDEKGRDCEAFRVVLPEAATSMTVAAIEDMLTIKELYVLNMQNISIRYDDTSYELPLTGAVTIYKLNAYCSGNNYEPSYCYLRVEMPAYGITVNAGANGKASADKTEAAEGETVKLTVTPNAGYMVDTLTVTDAEGKTIEVAEDNTFIMPGSAVTVDVTFKEVPPVYYNVTIEASQNGTVTADKETAILNDTVKLTATPAEGYTLKSLTVTTADGAAIEVAADNTFKMPAGDVKVTATFKSGTAARINLQITGYEIGKVAKYASVKMFDANGNDVTAGEWYICVVDSNEGCNWNIGELKANTRYWLRIERNISGYKASDFALMDMEAVSVTDRSESGNFLIYIELPQLKAPAVSYAIDTSKIVDGTVTAQVGGSAVTEATSGSTVTLTAAPNEGFTLGEVRVLDAAGTVIPVTGTGENTYIFVMPESAVQIHALFRQNVAEDKSTLTLGDAADVLAGDKIIIPVNVANAPSGNFYVFDMNVVLPEGWTLIGALEGADSRLNSTDSWMPTPSDSGYGLVAQYDGNNGVRFPNGEVMKLVIQIPAGATPGVYKLDVVSAGLSMDRVDSETSSFAQYIDGHVTVKAGPTEKTKLTTPAITDGMILAWEDMVESRNVPACQQDVNATVEYRLAETEEALESAEWILGTEPANYQTVYTDSIRWIKEDLKANTKYYLQIRYRAYNTNYFFDSDPYTTEFTTKAWIEEPVKITTDDATGRPGDTFTVTMNFEHAFDNQAFISKDYDFKFNDEHFTLQSINWTGDSGNKLPEGDVAELTFSVKDGVASGEYELALTSTNPFTLRYNRDGSGYYKHNREYPVNHTFTSGKITVLGRLAAPELTGYTATDDTITVTAPAAVTNGKVEYAISTKANETNFTWQDSNVFENLGEKTTYYVYARNVAIDKTLNGDSVVSAALEVKTVNPTATYTVASVEASPGKSVDVAVTLEHTIVKTADNFVIVPNAAEGLTLTAAKAGNDLGAGWSILVDEGTITVYRDDAAVIPAGEVIILTYSVSEDAESRELTVTLNAFGDDGCVFVNGETALRVDGTVTAGKVTVKALNPGDLNKNGVVDLTDLVALRRYLASWADYNEETLNLAAGDLNDDGKVDMRDAVQLSRKLAGWQ